MLKTFKKPKPLGKSIDFLLCFLLCMLIITNVYAKTTTKTTNEITDTTANYSKQKNKININIYIDQKNTEYKNLITKTANILIKNQFDQKWLKLLSEHIAKNLSISKQQELDHEITPQYLELLYNASDTEVNEVLIANGFYHTSISSNLKIASGVYNITYHVKLNKPTRIKDINLKIVDPNYPAELQPLLKTSKLHINDIIRHEAYEDAKEEILTKFIDAGYLNAHFIEHIILINQDTFDAAIILHIALGPRYSLGHVTFTSNLYKDYILQRYVPFEVNEPYTSKTLETLRRDLLESGFFETVKVYPEPNLQDLNDTTVPVRVKLTEKPKNRYDGSIGYGTNTGVRGSLGYLRRHISDSGQTFDAKLYASKIAKSLQLDYNIPGQNPTKNNYRIAAIARDERIKERLSQKFEVLGEKAQYQENIERKSGLKYLYEVYKIKPNDPKRNSTFLLPYFAYDWSKINEDDDAFFSLGKRVEFVATAGLNSLLSTTDVLQLELRGKWITSLTKSTRVLMRGEIGSISAKSFADIPVSMRFFTGGDYSVRGFAYKSLGPTEVDSDGALIVVGGKYKFIGSIELEQRIKEDIAVATFIDSGNSMNKPGASLATGAGVGLRFISKIGAFRIDVAAPTKETLDQKTVRLHINFGKDL